MPLTEANRVLHCAHRNWNAEPENNVILLIEPEQRLSPLKLVLETEQYNVLTADNMTNLRHLIENYPVNAVIVDADAKTEQYDCTMAAEHVKAIRREVPVIMLSSRHWVGKDYCDGADYNMVKGASPVEMIRAIEKIMGDPQPEVQIEPSVRVNHSHRSG